MILAADKAERQSALNKLLAMQREDISMLVTYLLSFLLSVHAGLAEVARYETVITYITGCGAFFFLVVMSMPSWYVSACT